MTTLLVIAIASLLVALIAQRRRETRWQAAYNTAADSVHALRSMVQNARTEVK